MAKQSKLELVLKFLTDRGPIGQARAEIGFLKDRLKALRETAGKTFSFAKSAASTFFLPLKTLALPAIGAVTAGFGLLLKSVKEFAGQELGEADVKSAMKAMGQYTDEYFKKIKGLADQYQSTTGIADDMWLRSFAMLTRFGANKGNIDQLAVALKNLTGLMDGNLDGATMAFQRALEGEFSMFSRYGIKVEQTGDKVKDLENLIVMLNRKGAGILETRAATLSGKWGQFKNVMSDTFEGLGKRVSDGFGLGKWIDRAKGKLKELQAAIDSGALGKALEKAAENFSKKLNAGFKWIGDLKKKFDESGQSFGEGVQNALKAAVSVFGDALLAMIQASFSLWKVAGTILFNTFKEGFLAFDWPAWTGMKGVRSRSAQAGVEKMTDSEAAGVLYKNKVISKDDLTNPVFETPGFWKQNLKTSIKDGNIDHESLASVASSGSAVAIEKAFKQVTEDLKTISSGLVTKATVAAEKAATGDPGQGAVRKQESRVAALEKEVTSFSDMAAQMPEGKAREAALKLQQEAQIRLQEQQTLLNLLQKGGDAQAAINDSQAAINARLFAQVSRIQSQVANGRL